MDDPELRQAVEKQLNKVEGSNKFARAISFGHNQEFTQSEKEDQEIAEGCRRLIKNAIVCWNVSAQVPADGNCLTAEASMGFKVLHECDPGHPFC